MEIVLVLLPLYTVGYMIMFFRDRWYMFYVKKDNLLSNKEIMINFLKWIKINLVQLSWIGILIKENIIGSVAGRAIEWTIYSIYFSIASFLYTSLSSMDFSWWKVALVTLGIWLAKTILECAMKYFRNK